MSLRFPVNSEAKALEILRNLENMLLRYSMHTYVFIMFKSSIAQKYATR